MLGRFAKDYWSLTEKPSESAQCPRRAALNSSRARKEFALALLEVPLGGRGLEGKAWLPNAEHRCWLLPCANGTSPWIFQQSQSRSENSTHRPGTMIVQRAGHFVD